MGVIQSFLDILQAFFAVELLLLFDGSYIRILGAALRPQHAKATFHLRLSRSLQICLKNVTGPLFFL